MHEAVLANFFRGKLTSTDLASDLEGASEQISAIETRTKIVEMKDSFLVTRQMAIALCDAVLEGKLPPEDLRTVGFTLVTSDAFYWDEEENELAETFHDWAAPRVNFELNFPNVDMFRRRLAAAAT